MFLGYFIILILALVFLPVIKINYLNSTQVDTFGLFHAYMWKTWSIIGLTLLFLFGYNFSSKMRHWLNKILWVTSNINLTNIWWLLIILVSLFSVWDTITLLKQSFSSRVWTTSWFLTLWILVIVWIVWNLMAARIEHKKVHTTKEVTIKQETDTSWFEPWFEKAKKEVEGLFGESM
jgi:hypothetical protein